MSARGISTAEAATDTPVLPSLELAVADECVRDGIVAAIRTILDPEIPVNIYDLGLIYRVAVNEMKIAEIDMTLTAPGCPVAGEIVGWVQRAVNDVAGVDAVVVRLVFEPPWDQSMMSEAAKLDLGLLF
jgi:FeS assembly SUF system protein